jgi:hypothetical protein
MKSLLPAAVLAVSSLAACGGSDREPMPPVAPVNRAPVAQPDVARTRPGLAVDVAVLANDSDPDGGVLSIVPPAAVASATVTVQPDNRLRVLPADGFGGLIEFTYQVQDAGGARSSPASVRVVVGPAGRALLGAIVTGGGGGGRVFVSGYQAGETVPLLEATCPLGRFAATSADHRTLVGVQCGSSPTRKSLVVMSPRATVLAPPVPLLSNVALARGFATSADFATVTVAERITNQDDPSLPGSYELVTVDVTTRTVTRRVPLPGIGRLESIQGIAGGDRLLLSTGDGATWFTGGDLYHADLQAGTIERVGQAGLAPSLETVFTSADGRYVLYQDWSGYLVGHDLTQPAQQITFWDNDARGSYVTQLSVAPAANGATMLALARDLGTQEYSVWELPLQDPASARQIRLCPRMWSWGIAFQLLAADRFLLVCDGAAEGHSEVHEVSLSSGATVREWTPAGGVPGLLQVRRQGPDALLMDFEEPATSGVRRRIAYVHSGSPGTLAFVMPDADLSDVLLGPGDRDGHAFALTNRVGGVITPHIVDVNLLTQAFPLQEGILPGEQVSALMVFAPTE